MIVFGDVAQNMLTAIMSSPIIKLSMNDFMDESGKFRYQNIRDTIYNREKLNCYRKLGDYKRSISLLEQFSLEDYVDLQDYSIDIAEIKNKINEMDDNVEITN